MYNFFVENVLLIVSSFLAGVALSGVVKAGVKKLLGIVKSA